MGTCGVQVGYRWGPAGGVQVGRGATGGVQNCRWGQAKAIGCHAGRATAFGIVPTAHAAIDRAPRGPVMKCTVGNCPGLMLVARG